MKMTKIAMAAAAAALTTCTAFADAQVYTFTATLKTTVAAKGKIKASNLTCLEEAETLVYRKQGTVRLEGLIWGCDCSALAGVSGWNGETEDGCAFWDKTNKQLLSGTFVWRLLNRIDSTAKKSEGAWTYESDCYYLTGGGFGTVKVLNEEVTLPTISGNVAGWKCAPGYTIKTGRYIPCTFCDPGEEESEERVTAVAWTLCDCGDSDEYTAVSGTWKLKYDAAATKKLRNSESIFNAYKFPAFVKSALD